MKRPISAYFSALAMLWFLSSSTATETRRLLNAYRSNLSSLTAPNSFYFLEFPLDDVLGYKNNGVQPICGNGTPYSFMFRRGSDKHISKLLVEFEGGPACWGEGSESCCDPNNPARLEAPWYGYLQKKEIEVIKTGQFPSLSSCRGIPAGFAKASSATYLVGQNNSDVPIALRSNAGGRNNDWWQTLGIKDGSDISDWSYILLPHCTLDWHLGFQENRQQTGCGSNEQIYHRGGANARAVLDWVKTQFPSGLDALVTISGGKIGGCPNTASSIAPAYFAMEAAMGIRHAPPSSMLVVAEGSILWNKNILPNHAKMIHTWNIKNLVPRGGLSGTVEYMVLNSPDALQFAWIASENGGTIEERTWTTRIKTTSPENFHVYVPNAVSQQETCPRFALPKEEQQFSDVMLSEFFSDIVYNHMSWASRSSSTITKKSPIFSNNEDPEDSNTKSSLRLSFLSVSVLFITLAILAWVWYFTLRAHRFRNDLPAPSSPTDLWFTALTYYPRLFLLVSVLLPITLSYIAFSKSGYKINVNLDFDTYLDIQTDLDSVAKSYAGLQEYQEESSVLETQNCLTLWNGIRQNDYYRHLDELSFISNIEEEPNYPLTERDLQAFYDGKYAFRSNGQLISIIYRNRRGGNVFQPEVLKSIRQFEQSILKFPGFTDYCFRLVGDRKCLPFGSLANNFFQYGRLVIDINNVLRSFLGDPQALWKMDQYFGPNNLQSNITKTFIWLKDVGGDQSAANPFLERLYRDLLWKVQKEQLYPELEITWSNLYLEKLEANDALHHDVLWSICSLGFIGLMIFLKVRDGFVFLFSLLGLLLSFFTAFYWVSVHFNIEEITLLHVSSLFVMLGIGADDIFLMLDSFDHTRVMSRFYIKADESDDNDEGEESMERQQRQADIIRERMKSAYTTAGSMMLVSSMTTATCFFSNAFGVLVVIQEFGIYMGMVVLVNYLHVMTILPSAILVNELYFLPWKTRLWNKYVVQQRITREAKTGDIVNEKYQTDTEGVLKRHVSIGSEDNESNDDLSLHPREDLGSTKDGEGGSTKSLASSESSGEHGELNDIFKDTSRLKRMDRWLLKVHAPFIIKRPLFVVFFTVSLALILVS